MPDVHQDALLLLLMDTFLQFPSELLVCIRDMLTYRRPVVRRPGCFVDMYRDAESGVLWAHWSLSVRDVWLDLRLSDERQCAWCSVRIDFEAIPRRITVGESGSGKCTRTVCRDCSVTVVEPELTRQFQSQQLNSRSRSLLQTTCLSQKPVATLQSKIRPTRPTAKPTNTSTKTTRTMSKERIPSVRLRFAQQSQPHTFQRRPKATQSNSGW